jgi:hypothetical protein
LLVVSRLHAGVLAAALALSASPALAAAERHHEPSAAQVKAALARAARSPDLWATVNICDTPRYPDTIGIRGQMPGLGFAARLYMRVRVEYWSDETRRFELVPGVDQTVSVGRATRGVHQSGVTFQFIPPAGTLRGLVTFEWKRSGRVLGRLTRKTGHGYQHVDFADPPGYSAGTCSIT